MSKCLECSTVGRDGYGYPVVTFKGKRERAYRVVFMVYKGEIPFGAVVRHTCDNKLCINPDHLLLGEHTDNVADRVARGRSATGERNGRSKLNIDQVMNILVDNVTPKMSLAKRHGVSPKVVRDIKQGKTWREVTGL